MIRAQYIINNMKANDGVIDPTKFWCAGCGWSSFRGGDNSKRWRRKVNFGPTPGGWGNVN
jgi:hypothetical protein